MEKTDKNMMNIFHHIYNMDIYAEVQDNYSHLHLVKLSDMKTILIDYDNKYMKFIKKSESPVTSWSEMEFIKRFPDEESLRKYIDMLTKTQIYKFDKVKKEICELRNEFYEIKEMIKYLPNGKEFEKAKNNFLEKAN